MAKSFSNLGVTTGLSSDRTALSSAFTGQEFFETDTKKMFVYSGSGWVQTNSWATTSGVTGVSNLIVPPMVRVAKSANQSIPNVSGTLITFSNAAAFNTDSMHDAVTNNTRFTINTAGVYMVTGGAWFATSATGSYRICSIFKNGSEMMSTNMKSSAAEHRGIVSYLDTCVAGDYFELLVYQDSGGALNTYNHNFMAHWVGRTS